MPKAKKQVTKEDLVRELDELGREFDRMITEETMASKSVNRLAGKLKKVNESMTLHFYDNGYMVEVSGRNKNDDYTTAKILCNTLAEVVELINEADAMERDS